VAGWEEDLSEIVQGRVSVLKKMKEVVAPKVTENIEHAQTVQKRNYDARHNLQKVNISLKLFSNKKLTKLVYKDV